MVKIGLRLGLYAQPDRGLSVVQKVPVHLRVGVRHAGDILEQNGAPLDRFERQVGEPREDIGFLVFVGKVYGDHLLVIDEISPTAADVRVVDCFPDLLDLQAMGDQFVPVHIHLNLPARSAEGPGRLHAVNALKLGHHQVFQELLQPGTVVTLVPHGEMHHRDILPVHAHHPGYHGHSPHSGQFPGKNIDQVFHLRAFFVQVDPFLEIEHDERESLLGHPGRVLDIPCDLEFFLQRLGDVAVNLFRRQARELGDHSEILRGDVGSHPCGHGGERIYAQRDHQQGNHDGNVRIVDREPGQAEARTFHVRGLPFSPPR